MSFPILTATAVLPAVGAIVTAAVPAARRTAAKWVALLFSLATLVMAAIVLVRFEPGGERYQLTESHAWIADFGVRYELGVDGIGVVMVALTALLIPFVILAGWHDADPLENKSSRWRPTQGFFALILMVEAMVVLSFEATDVFLFYILFEAMLIPMYFLIGGFGDRAHSGTDENAAAQRSYAAVKFLLYNLAGGLIMLAAVIGLYVVAGSFSLSEIAEARANGSLEMATTTERLLFLGFFFAFAIKAPLWPLHTWLPNAMGEATAPVAVLITAVVDKVGTFAMLRFCLQLFPEASKWATPAIIVLALVSIVYGALLAVGQRDIKRLIAYASVSHFGFIILGIFAMTSQGQSGATLYMVNHLGFPVPSTCPIRLRAVIGRAVAPGERLKPFICQRTRAAAPAAFWIARSAWKATRASLAPICTQRSPLERPASNWSEENAGSGSRPGGRCATRAVRSKKERPNPKVTVSEDGPASSATPVSPPPAGRPAIRSAARADQRRISAAASLRPAPGARSKATR
jgi:proton-translocating NADH-quinone oxidoreductase chain M